MAKSKPIRKSVTPPGFQSRQWWLWVTKPEFFLDENLLERADLDPSQCEDSDGWWTCHRDTKAGDMAFLWRTRPKSDIGYLIRARSDAYSIVDDDLHPRGDGITDVTTKFCTSSGSRSHCSISERL